MPLCTYCESIFKDTDSNELRPHHPDFHSFRSSVDSGCQLCKCLWRSLDKDTLCILERSTTCDIETRFHSVGYNVINIGFYVTCDGTHVSMRNFDLVSEDYVLGLGSRPRSARMSRQLNTSINTSTNTGSDESLLQSLSWVKNCHASHHCSPNTDDRMLPTRLIRVGKIGDETISLRSTVSLPPRILYMTLSHCWGKFLPFTLTKKNLASLQSGFALADLPQTFRDAIHVTRKFQISYLWIDSICIIQDSIEDWMTESLRMASVYSYSYCNIAATRSADSRGGCFVDRPSWIIEPVKLETSTQSYDVFNANLWTEEITESVLLSRAWVLQERLLAPRVLHFAKSQIVFECCVDCACETYPQGFPGLIHTAEKGKMDFQTKQYSYLSHWQKLITTYSKSFLTYEGDRFLAMAGLARAFQPRIKGRYLAGMWEQDLLEQLLWKREKGSPISTSKLPTWCWACRPGAIEAPYISSYTGNQSDDVYILPIVEEVFMLTSDADELSQPISGFLRLKGSLIPALINKEKTFRGGLLSIRNRKFDAHFDVPEETIPGKLLTVLCSYNFDKSSSPSFKSAEGLILQATPGTPGQYHRVGVYSQNWYQSIESDVHPLLQKNDASETAEITEDMYEKYDPAEDKYTFTIV